MRRICQRSVLLVLFLLAVFEARGAERIVRSGETVELTGRVQIAAAYGPPTFGENPASDAREVYYALVSDVPVRRRFDDGKLDEASAAKLQLFFTPMSDRLRGQLEEAARLRIPISVTGQAMFAHTGHHHEPILLEVRKVTRRN